MTDLNLEARRILAQAKAGQARAPQALRARVKSQVERALSAAESGNVIRPTTAKRVWLLPSAGAVTVLAGLALIAGLQPAASPTQPAPVQPPAAVVEIAQPSPMPSLRPAPGAEPQPAAEELAAAANPASRPTPAVRPDDLRAEMQLLSRAEAALRADDPQAALQVLRTHAQRFRSGQLHDERDGLRLIALCALGRDPGAALTRHLDKRSDAVLHARVSEACSRFAP